MLSAELTEDGGQGFVYRLLGERLQKIKQRKDASDKATEDRLQDLQNIAEDLAQTKTEPERLNLTQPGEYALFTVLRGCATTQDESYLADCARRMIGQLQTHQLLAPDGADQKVDGCGWGIPYWWSHGIQPMPNSVSIPTIRNRRSWIWH